MTQRVTGHVQLKALRAGGRAKASLNRATRYVAVDPKPWRSTLEQGEAAVTGGGGRNCCGWKPPRMTGGQGRRAIQARGKLVLPETHQAMAGDRQSAGGRDVEGA